jgi:hypothetical protein
MFRKRLTDKQWDKIRVHLPRAKKKPWRRKDRKGDGLGSAHGSVSTAFSGSCVPERLGTRCPSSTAKRARPTEGCAQWANDGVLEKLGGGS